MNHRPTFKHAYLMLALAAAWPLTGHAAAGVAQFIAGDVNVRRGSANETLAKGRPIESGDDIVTGPNGQAQIKFSDGGLVSLQPNTQFKITRYNDAGDPKQDGFLVDFVRGGMRAITGLIGHRNRENYKVQTATATIGIRGSAWSAGYAADGSLNVQGEQDEIEVCTNSGCVGLKRGESARVNSPNSTPTRTGIVVSFPTTPAPLPVTFATSGENAFSGTLTNLTVGLTGNGFGLYVFPNDTGDATTFTAGAITNFQHTDAGEGQSTYVYAPTAGALTSFGNVGRPTDADYLGWGYWSEATEVSSGYGGSSTLKDVHYIVGQATPVDSMPANGMVGTYALVGGTAPTATYNGVSTIGTLLGGTMTAYFGVGVDVSISTKFGANQVDINVTGASISGNTFYGYCGSAEVNGLFVGPGATRAGVVYQTYDNTVGNVRGAAGFSLTNLSMGQPL